MFQWVTFGKAKYDNSVFSEDIIVSTDGDVYSRAADGLRVTPEELDASIDENTKIVVVGTGHYGVVRVTPEAMSYLKDSKIELVEKPTKEAVEYYNKRMSVKGRKPKITAIIHVT